jgi:hypothetical protein
MSRGGTTSAPRTAGVNGTASRKTSGARLWFVIHGWLALPIWVFLFFVCLTVRDRDILIARFDASKARIRQM